MPASVFMRKLRHKLALAKHYKSVEGCSYGAVSQILDAFAAIHDDDDRHVEVGSHPQIPFFDRAVVGDKKGKRERRTPDFALFTTTLGRHELKAADLIFWVEVKCPSYNRSVLGEEVFDEAIAQVNVQAAFAFHTLNKGDTYYAFIISLNRFSLLRYTRPGKQEEHSDGESDEEASADDDGDAVEEDSGQQEPVDLNIAGLPSMPDIPKVIYWSQPMFTSGQKGFSRTFLKALDHATKHLGLIRQPSWFDLKDEEGTPAAIAKRKKERLVARVCRSFI